jgi:N-carbamoyl-L-amino-acid hydrolase
MADAGLAVSVDAGGNLIGRREGLEPDLPCLMLGSHTDTVVGGGRFDGIVGVLAAIETARCLPRLRHPLEVVDFLAEEPTDFGISTVGSRAIAGSLSASMLAFRSDAASASLADAIASVGGRPDALVSRRDVAVYLELHIEQGPVLEREGLHLGVVTAITGIARFSVRVVGRSDHAGTMPMSVRRDALAAASEMVLGLEGLWSDGAGVGTVGRVFVEPNATNVVPGAVEFTAEMRSVDPGVLRERQASFSSLVSSVAARREVAAEVSVLSSAPPVPVPDHVQSVLADVVSSLGHPARRLPSYAGHDANQIARIAPIGMLFIPSRDGRSHCPEEWTEAADVALGAQALTEAVRRLDAL